MVGSIGVAPPLNVALYAGDAWIYGGNLDYNRVTSGTTLYFPVYRAGAHLFLGDGHAAQGDGEISGQGLETSLDVEFTVELVKGNAVGQLWSERRGERHGARLRELARCSAPVSHQRHGGWLKLNQGLNDSEVAAVLGTSLRYDVAAIVNTRPHIVARLSKKTLAMISRPSL
jgi:acetamidase/formamidase